jgi:hypothetical protein
MLLLGNHSIWSDEAIFLSQFVALTHERVVGSRIPVQRNSLGVCQIPRHMSSQWFKQKLFTAMFQLGNKHQPDK